MEREHPGACAGCNRAACGGCSQGGCPQGGGTLLLCREEIGILEELGQFAFLPLLTKREQGGKRYLPVEGAFSLDPAHFSEALESLAWKGLIVLDEDLPIAGLEYGGAALLPDTSCGSAALTLRGQEAVTQLDLTP